MSKNKKKLDLMPDETLLTDTSFGTVTNKRVVCVEHYRKKIKILSCLLNG